MDFWTNLFNAFLEFDIRSWTTLVASGTALVLSYLSYRQRSGETRLALRKQLTDLLEKLSDINMEGQKFRAKSDGLPVNFMGLLNDQRRFLVRQASFIAAQINEIVSPYEYLLLAGAFDEINDSYQAEMFFKKAIKAAPHPFETGIAVRSYARYLFNQSKDRHDEARRLYQKSVDLFVDETDRFRVARFESYERWAYQEHEWGNLNEAATLFQQALHGFETITNPTRRQYECNRISRIISDRYPSKDNIDLGASGDASEPTSEEKNEVSM